MSKWPTTKISDICTRIAMGPFGSNIKVDNFVPSGVPVLNGANLAGFKLKEDSFNYVTEHKAEELKNSLAYRGDIVVTHRGTLGQIVYIPSDSRFDKYLISQSQFLLRVDSDKADSRFITYFFHSVYGQYLLLSNASQVGVPALARPTSTFKSLEIPLPPLRIQKKIADFLCLLDKKVQLNAQINRNLEQQAQVIFKSWFVDFEPFRDEKFVDSELGPIPEGWRIVPLDEIADFLNGLPMQKYRPATDRLGLPVLKIKELREQFCSADSERCLEDIKQEYVVEDGDVVFSWSGSLLIDIWTGGRCGLNQHLFKVTSTQHEKWFYYLWTCHHLANFIAIAADKATTMGHIQRGHIHAALTLVPSKQEYEELSAILSPIIDKMIHSRLESRRLSTLRDTLLPKLMSGEIDVSEVEV